MKIRQILPALQSIPQQKKKMLVWGITIAVGVMLLGWWGKHLKDSLSALQNSNVEKALFLPELKDTLNNGPR